MVQERTGREVTVATPDKCEKCGCKKTVDNVIFGSPKNFKNLGKGEKAGRPTMKRVFVECADCGNGMGTWKEYF